MKTLKLWERRYPEEGAEGFMAGSTGTSRRSRS